MSVLNRQQFLSIHRRPNVSRPIVSLTHLHLPVFLSAVPPVTIPVPRSRIIRPAVPVKMSVQSLRTIVVAPLRGRPTPRREPVPVESASTGSDVSAVASSASSPEGHLRRSESDRVVPAAVSARRVSG